jgi:hypothetical protein
MMFYMAADNDLHGQALTDIEELRTIAGKPGVDILVQLDSPSGAFRYKVLPQGTSTLASLGQVNSGSPGPLAEFGCWAVKTYPAQKYLLVLWDHGDGWGKPGKNIGLDGIDFLSVAGGELRAALSKISAAAGQPLDLVIFDACSMQMAGVLMELDGLCRYAVGSEALFPVEGMPYQAAWKDINESTPADSLAIMAVNACSLFNGQGYQTTCSAIDVSALSSAAQNLKSLTGRLRQLPVSNYLNPSAVSDSVLSFPPYSSYDLPLTLDLIGSGLPDPEKSLVLDAARRFRGSVLAQAITGSQYRSAQGLAVWYPYGRINFESGINTYRKLNWSGLSGWDRIAYQLIFQTDSTAPIPQNVSLDHKAGGLGNLTWENGYEPSGIDGYQIRHSQNLVTDFYDRGGRADSANWTMDGFTILPRANGDTAYYSSIGGRITGRKAMTFDSSGSIGFNAEGFMGALVLESSGDTANGWDTLGVWNCFSDSSEKYYSAQTNAGTESVRFSWRPFSGGYRVFIDDIRACHPDTAGTVEIIRSTIPAYSLGSQPGAAGFYQVRSVDSLNNQSSWSDARHYQPDAGLIRTWPNPFKDKVSLLFSSSTERIQEVNIYNILGQFIDRMSLGKRAINGETAENLYYWKPKTAMAEGIYFARLKTDAGIRAVKMILIR